MTSTEDFKTIVINLSPVYFETPVEWVCKNVDLSKDYTSDWNGCPDFDYTPYLRDPLNFWARDGRAAMTCVAVEQTGKSSVWKWGSLWAMEHKPAPMLTVYPSDADAQDANTDSLEPLMRNIPRFALELERTKSRRKDCYRFTFAPYYFSGGGADIISKPFAYVIGDEVDFWKRYNETVDNVNNLDKRRRTFRHSLRVLVCSIKQHIQNDSVIWREFQKSSQGYWHLRCLKCGKLSMRSADVFNLQWQLDDKEDVVNDSIRLTCPECKHEHAEADKRAMNMGGQYIHQFPDRMGEHVGFQWGALASQMPGLCWIEIAKAQMLAGKSARLEDQMLFDNSFRGLPFIPRKDSDTRTNSIRNRMQPLPAPETINAVFVAVDTQDDCLYYRIRGIDLQNNTYSLTPKIKLQGLQELEEAWTGSYMGLKPLMGFIDAGGHRTEEIMKWVATHKDFFAYKGDSRIGTQWKLSSENNKLILVNPKLYQSKLLYYLYSQKNTDNNYMYFHPEETTELIEQITDFKPNSKVKNGHDYENWTSSGDDHCFDCEKMMLALIDIAKRWKPADKWRHGKVDAFAQKRPPPPQMVKPNISGFATKFSGSNWSIRT